MSSKTLFIAIAMALSSTSSAFAYDMHLVNNTKQAILLHIVYDSKQTKGKLFGFVPIYQVEVYGGEAIHADGTRSLLSYIA